MGIFSPSKKKNPEEAKKDVVALVQRVQAASRQDQSQPSQDIPWDTPLGETQMASQIQYVKGEGKENKAEYRIGKASVPAALITRILDSNKNSSDTKLGSILFARIEKKHPKFVDALEASGIELSDAIKQMREIKPPKFQGTGQRTPKIAKTAEALAKGICKRFKGEPEEIVKKFAALVSSDEFQKEAIDIISSYKKQFGLNSLGFIKCTSRMGNPAAQKALAKFRATRAPKVKISAK